MQWWDTVDYADALRDWVQTVHAIPEPLLCACGDARAAVLLGLESACPQSLEAARLFKLLTFIS